MTDEPMEPPLADMAQVWKRVPTRLPHAYITIDDGYQVTQDAAAYVRALNLPITMFLTWYAVVDHVDHFKQYGFTARVGNHSTTHGHMTGWDLYEQRRQIDMCTGNLRNHLGIAPSFFRPPYGDYNDDTRRAAKAAGFPVVHLWDTAWKGGVKVEGGPLVPGSILLAHFEDDLLPNLRDMVAQVKAAGLVPQPLPYPVTAGEQVRS